MRLVSVFLSGLCDLEESTPFLSSLDIHLLKRPGQLSCEISHFLDFPDPFLVTQFNLFLCPLYFSVIWKLDLKAGFSYILKV